MANVATGRYKMNMCAAKYYISVDVPYSRHVTYGRNILDSVKTNLRIKD